MKYKVMFRSTNVYYNILSYTCILILIWATITFIIGHEVLMLFNIIALIVGFIILIDAIWDTAIIALDDRIIIRHGFWLLKQEIIKSEEITHILSVNSSIKSFLRFKFSRYQTINMQCTVYPGNPKDKSLVILLDDDAIALSCKEPDAIVEILTKKYDKTAENINIPTWLADVMKHKKRYY